MVQGVGLVFSYVWTLHQKVEAVEFKQTIRRPRPTLHRSTEAVTTTAIAKPTPLQRQAELHNLAEKTAHAASTEQSLSLEAPF